MRKTAIRTMSRSETNLGSVLLMQRRVTLEQLNAARIKQDESERAGSKKPIGEILIEDKACTLADVEAALRVQEKMRGRADNDACDEVGGLLDLVRQRLNTPVQAKASGG